MKMALSGELDELIDQPARDHLGQLRTQPQRRLTPERQLELVERYRAGALQRELAEAYEIPRGTVGQIIKRHDAQRKYGLDNAEVEVAIYRYAKGASLATIGRELGVDAQTVRNYLLKHGVEMRDSHGRPRKSEHFPTTPPHDAGPSPGQVPLEAPAEPE